MGNTCQTHVKCFICRKNWFDENWQEAYYQQYHPKLRNKEQFPSLIFHQQAGNDSRHPVSTSVVATEWSSMTYWTDDFTLDRVPGEPPSEDAPDQETMDQQKPDPWCILDTTKTKACSMVVAVVIAGGKANGNKTGLYNLHRKYAELGNRWHPFRGTHDLQQAQSFCQQTQPGSIIIWAVDSSKSPSNHSNQQMPCQSSSLVLNLVEAMIVGLKNIHIPLEHNTTGIHSNEHSCFWHISHFRWTSVSNRRTSRPWILTEYTVGWIWVIGSGRRRTNISKN